MVAEVRPYYSDGGIVIYHGDMLELLSQLGRFDVAATDGPFGIGDKPLGARKAGQRWVNVALKSTAYHAPSEWDKAINPAWCSTICAAAPIVAWFGSWKRRLQVEAAMPHPIRCEIVWAKDVHVGPPCPAAMRDERIWIFSAKAFVGQHFETTVWDEPIIPTWQRRQHKNEKPERLMGRLVRWVAPPGSRGVDPFMGSGSTLVVAKQLGFPWVGIDIDEAHCETAAKRLGKVVRDDMRPVGPLFDLARSHK